ncbi:hypothetical protein A3C37_01825 [Candidatus Peribacteria bacterium RIFCSPHIGHO2_02_FULL_53_20]|nr:MAG: hypothetical protein A3C37_01825 [Candidatus Peribacteria bacterium RIFCSPHIGHO2_02_FULL_53_20]
MASPNPTKHQHFVPLFYLKNFADNDGYLDVLNIKEKRMAKRRPYQGLGYEYYYYAVNTGMPDDTSQQVEEWLKPTEDYLAKQLPRIIDVILQNQQIEDNDRYILAVLMSMLWLRTPSMRNDIQQTEDQMVEQIKRLHGTEYANQLRSTDNITHLKFMVETLGFGGPGFTNLFFSMKWKAYIARGKEVFITSDSPVVEKFPPPTSFWGAHSFLERNKYFALTPDILFELTEPVGSTKVRRKTIYEEDDDIVKTLNMILISGAQDYAYSGSRICLDQILAGRNNPGYLEKKYLEQYEKPWAEYHAKMRT